MKDILLLFTVSFLLSVNSTLAGGDRELNEEEANRALELWRKHCLDQNEDSQEYSFHGGGYGGYGPEAGESKAQIHCKFGPDYVDDSKVVVKPTYATPPKPIKQIIFITPPVHNVRHEITLQSAPTPPRKTLIYVFPAKNTHQFQYQDNRVVNTQKLKPMVYFLKNNQLKHPSGGYGGGYSGINYEPAASSLPAPQIQPITQQQLPLLVDPEPSRIVSPSIPVQQQQLPLLVDPEPSRIVSPSIPVQQQQLPLVVEPTRIVRPSKPEYYGKQKDFSKSGSPYNYINIPTEKVSKGEKPSFTIVPATFAGYYYSGPNDNNVNNRTPL